MRTLQIRSERRFEKMCAGKKSYLSIQAAEQAMKSRMWRVRGLELRIYPCPICPNYHLTSQNP